MEPNDLQLAAAAIADALRTVVLPEEWGGALRVYTEAGEQIDPIAAAIGLPLVNFTRGYATAATFTVGLIGAISRIPHLNEELMGSVPIVVEALYGALASKASVGTASPGTWPNGGVELPAFLIEIEVALPWR